jgi:hypothetical protein
MVASFVPSILPTTAWIDHHEKSLCAALPSSHWSRQHTVYLIKLYIPETFCPLTHDFSDVNIHNTKKNSILRNPSTFPPIIDIASYSHHYNVNNSKILALQGQAIPRIHTSDHPGTWNPTGCVSSAAAAFLLAKAASVTLLVPERSRPIRRRLCLGRRLRDNHRLACMKS